MIQQGALHLAAVAAHVQAAAHQVGLVSMSGQPARCGAATPQLAPGRTRRRRASDGVVKASAWMEHQTGRPARAGPSTRVPRGTKNRRRAVRKGARIGLPPTCGIDVVTQLARCSSAPPSSSSCGAAGAHGSWSSPPWPGSSATMISRFAARVECDGRRGPGWWRGRACLPALLGKSDHPAGSGARIPMVPPWRCWRRAGARQISAPSGSGASAAEVEHQPVLVGGHPRA